MRMPKFSQFISIFFLSFLLLSISQQTCAYTKRIIVLISTEGSKVEFPHYLPYLSPYIAKKVSTTTHPEIQVKVSSDNLLILKSYVWNIKNAARNTYRNRKPYLPDISDINYRTIFANPLAKIEVRETRKRLNDNTPLSTLLHICYELEISVLTNAFASLIADDIADRDEILFKDIPIEEQKYIRKYNYLRENQIRELNVADAIALYGQPQKVFHMDYKEGIFIDLSKQRITSLYGIHHIRNVKQLLQLRIENNPILSPEIDPEFPKKPFYACKNLRRLNLRGNNLTDLPVTFFNGLSNLQELDMTRNHLSLLPTEMFLDTKDLRILILRYSKITTIQRETLHPLKWIETIDLSYNKLTSIEESTFCGLVHLKKLNLAVNDIHHIEKTAFQDLIDLNILSLNSNKLATEKLLQGTFEGLYNLTKLSVDNNCLGDLEREDFVMKYKLDTNKTTVRWGIQRNEQLDNESRSWRSNALDIIRRPIRWLKDLVSFRINPSTRYTNNTC